MQIQIKCLYREKKYDYFDILLCYEVKSIIMTNKKLQLQCRYEFICFLLWNISFLYLMLEVHGILVDHPLCDVEQPSSLDPIQRLCFIWAQIKRNLTRGHWDKDKQYKGTPFHLHITVFIVISIFHKKSVTLTSFSTSPPLLYNKESSSPGKPWFVMVIPVFSSPSITMEWYIF